MKIKQFITGITLLGAVALFATGCDKKEDKAQNEADDYVFKIAETDDVCGAPQHIAVEKGFFEEEGLKFEIIQIGKDTSNLDAMNAGKLDGSYSLLASLFQPLVNGADLKIVTGIHTGCLQLLVGKDSTIKDAKDLIGKKIGVPSIAGSPATFTKRYLANAGIDVSEDSKEVEFIAYDSGVIAQALEKKQVDAIALSDPATELAKQEYGFTTLVNQATDEPYASEPCCVGYVSGRVVKEHPEAVAKYARAIQKATKWVEANKKEAAQIQHDKKLVEGELSVNEALLESYHYDPTYAKALQAFDNVGSDLKKIGIVKKDVDIEALKKATFLKEKGVE